VLPRGINARAGPLALAVMKRRLFTRISLAEVLSEADTEMAFALDVIARETRGEAPAREE
jgi:hypothetical protein